MRRALALLALLLVVSLPKGAMARPKLTGFADVGLGVAAPIYADGYKNFADPSFQLSLSGGVLFRVHRHVELGPELDLHIVTVNPDDAFADRGVDAHSIRVRALGGLRVAFPVSIFAPFVRFGVGIDYLSASLIAATPGGAFRATYEATSTVFGGDVGVGFEVRPIKHLALGVQASFPFAEHTLRLRAEPNGVPIPSPFVVSTTFWAVDVSVSAFVGLRW